jgi:2-polyprenyl-6-methoxyphenol hydroxylase-like FAD-dependent oxidoreductase
MSERHVVIVGAGPAGVAAAVALKDRGIRPIVVDQAESVASSCVGATTACG